MNALLFSLGISAGITALSAGLEYAITKRNNMPAPRSLSGGYVPQIMSPFSAGYFKGAGEMLISHLENRKRRCDYCKTVQSGEHCSNCGAPC